MKTVGGVKDEKVHARKKDKKSQWTCRLHPALSYQSLLINILCLTAAEGKGFKQRWKTPVMSYCTVIQLKGSLFLTICLQTAFFSYKFDFNKCNWMIFILITCLCLILFNLLQSVFPEWYLSWGYRTELCTLVLNVSF